MATPALTTIDDILYAPDGTLVNGVIYITNVSTMISPEGDEIPQGSTKTIRIVAGVLSVALVPNTGSTPNGTSYLVKYGVTQGWFTESWIVPESPNPCNLSDVRALTPPIPNIMIPVQQVLPPSNMESGDVLEWNGTQWVPGTAIVSSSFDEITTGTNTEATMTVGTGAEITYTGAGVVNANEVGSINVDGNSPTHAGQLLISQPGDESAAWADPQVQGLYAAGSSIAAPPSYVAPTTIQPVLVGAANPSGKLGNLNIDANGNLYVTGTVEVYAAGQALSTTSSGSPATEYLNVWVGNQVSFSGTVTVSNFPSGFEVLDGSGNILLTSTHPGVVTGTVAATQSGTWTSYITNTASLYPSLAQNPVGGSGTTSITPVAFGSANVAGHGITVGVAIQISSGNVTSITLSDTNGNTYVSQAFYAASKTSNAYGIFTASAIAAGANSITPAFTGSGAGTVIEWALVALEYNNVSTVNCAENYSGFYNSAAIAPSTLAVPLGSTAVLISMTTNEANNSTWTTSSPSTFRLAKSGGSNAQLSVGDIQNAPAGVVTFADSNSTIVGVLILATPAIGGVTQAAGPWTQNLTQVAGTALGAPSAYGTSPGTVKVIGVNANVTNAVSATISAASNSTQPGTGTTALQVDQAANLLTFPGAYTQTGAQWTTSTALNTFQYPNGQPTTVGRNAGAPAIVCQLDMTGTFTGGTATFQGTYDGTNWVTMPTSQLISPQTFVQLANPYAFVSNTNTPFLILMQGFQQVRINLTAAITGSSTPTVAPFWSTIPYKPEDLGQAFWGGGFTGTANTALQGYNKAAAPTVFKTVQATSSGNTAIWTPGSGNKFRLLKFRVEVTSNAAQSSAGVTTISFQDGSTGMPVAVDVYIPGTAVTTTPGAYDTGWVDLGVFGILSSTAGNALNVNLSAAITTGNARVMVAGTEE